MPEAKFNQASFSGGINQQIDTTRIGTNEYPLLINGRNRYDVIEPINLPEQVIDSVFPLNAKFQGLYAAENILIVIAEGQAFWKDWNIPNSYFTKIPDFQLAASADIIYAASVPVSFLNFARVPEATDMTINTDVNFSSVIDSSPQGFVVQDGLNQPWFISSTMTARPLQNYGLWNISGANQGREYVPVGQQMLFHNGVLYIVAPGGRQIYRSVTGRPLDFMVNILPNSGDKSPNENQGDAATTSHSVDYDQISAIAPLNTDDGAFFVATKRSSFAVTPDYDSPIFGEPQFSNRFLFSVGCVSPFAVVEMLGDYALTDFNGLRSFNAILQAKNEGRNTPFSKKLGPILQGIQQDYVCSINFDNYALFAVNTIYGRAVIAYDTLLDCFAAVDVYPDVGQIRQFAEVKTNSGKILFAITSSGLYQMFAGDKANCQLYVGEWCSNDPEVDQKISLLKIVFIDAESNGTVNATPYVDRKEQSSQDQPIQLAISTQLTPPINPPYGQNTTDTVQTLTFDFGRALQGWKVGFWIEWDFQAKLSHIALMSSAEKNINTLESQAKMYARNLAALND